MIPSSPFDWSGSDNLPSGWVLGNAGFHGPPHVIDYLERELDGTLAAAREGLPTEDRASPVIAVLLLVETARGLKSWIEARAAAPRSEGFGLDAGRPGLLPRR